MYFNPNGLDPRIVRLLQKNGLVDKLINSMEADNLMGIGAKKAVSYNGRIEEYKIGIARIDERYMVVLTDNRERETYVIVRKKPRPN